MPFDFKKEYKELYLPKNKPQIVNVPKVMSATLNVVVSINSTTVMQTYWTASSTFLYMQRKTKLEIQRESRQNGL